MTAGRRSAAPVWGRRAKLVCTLGPATATPDAVRALVDAGMDVARVNFSHGTDDDHRRSVENVRQASRDVERPIAVLADLSGPKVRLGELAGGSVTLEEGRPFELRPEDPRPGDSAGACVSHPGLANDLRRGDRVLLADGAAELLVTGVGATITTDVVSGGVVSNRAGVNVPSERLSLPPITDKDRVDLERALDLGVDLVAQSFVRRGTDVLELRELMGDRRVPIIAKIENRSAVDNAEDVARTADAVMVARGDLGVGLPLEDVPVVQKELVRLCIRLGTPVVVATQMLESMLHARRPTRAEVSDAANAILDGADALMLSGETAIGEFPIEAARRAVRIAEVAEARGSDFRGRRAEPLHGGAGRTVARAACSAAAQNPEIDAIACFTRTGRTAALIAAERPAVPIYALSPNPRMVRAMALLWGVRPALSEAPDTTDEMIELLDAHLVSSGLASHGQLVALVAAAPMGARTNLLKIHRLGSPGIDPDPDPAHAGDPVG